MQETIPVDVIASFNKQGQIKPLYMRLENPDATRNTFQITGVVLREEIKPAGFPIWQFHCIIASGQMETPVLLRYNLDTGVWSMLR